MKDWKTFKDKEVVIGLIIIIILGAIALTLLIRREVQHQKNNAIVWETKEEVVVGISEEKIEEVAENTQNMENQTIKGKDDLEKETETENEQDEEVILSSVQIVTQEATKKTSKEQKKEVSLYGILGNERYAPCYLTDRKQDDGQLKELFEYWDAYKLDAVAELIRLERMQKISEELESTDKFYYYGEVDRLGRPNGKGLAVYEDNTYYCGEWRDGLRHGKGMWLEVAIYTEENSEYNLGVIEHSYSGQWSKDLPNGEGQEHFSYDFGLLKQENMKDGKCITNVIGGFKDGYYNGEMYIMTIDSAGRSIDWYGTCEGGVWETIKEGNTTDAVWESNEKDSGGNQLFHYLLPKENQNYGIMGLKK